MIFHTDPVAPLEDLKIIRKKLNGYVGFANLPKQWHRKSVRRGFNLNVMVVGEPGLGKTTLVNTLFNKQVLSKDHPLEDEDTPLKVVLTASEIEEDGIKLRLNVVTAPGFGAHTNNTEAWKPIAEEISSRFDQYLETESRITRTTIEDPRIHALLYFIEPSGHSLRALDIAFMKQVHDKVNLIPVIAKADTLTDDEIADFKRRIVDDINYQGISVFKPSVHETDDDDAAAINSSVLSKLPFAVVGSTNYVQAPDGRSVRGRSYPWGIIEVENENHNDFVRLRELLIRNYMEELKEHTSNVLYENYRSAKLTRMGIEQDDSVFKEFDPLAKQEEEKQLHEAKLAKMEAEMKAVFQQKVSEKEKKLQRSEADLFSRHKEMKDKLSKQIKLLEDKKAQLEKQKLLPQDPPAPAPQKTRKGFLR